MYNKLHPILWLWLPLAWLIVIIALELTNASERLAGLYSEKGPHENLQFVILLMAFLIAVRTLFIPGLRQHRLLFAWVAIAALACFYIGGEEISWGQTYLQWHTPEYWAEINDQDETNLHNTSSWFDQKPRLMMMIGVLVGGVLIPLIQRFRPAMLPPRYAVFYPPAITSVSAGLATVAKFFDELGEGLDVKFLHRSSEVIEIYMYYFVLIYLLVLWNRARKLPLRA